MYEYVRKKQEKEHFIRVYGGCFIKLEINRKNQNIRDLQVVVEHLKKIQKRERLVL